MVRVTPHVSWSDPAFLQRLTAKIAANLDRYLAGEPLVDVVEPGRAY